MAGGWEIQVKEEYMLDMPWVIVHEYKYKYST